MMSDWISRQPFRFGAHEDTSGPTWRACQGFVGAEGPSAATVLSGI